MKGILEAAEITPEDTALEIGAGPGNFTRLLVATGARVVALEMDRRFEANLRHLESRHPNLVSAWGDALELDWEPLWGEAHPDRRVIVGNIPFQITSPLLDRLSRARGRFRHAVIMVQREVADRLVAPPGGRVRGALGVKIALDFAVTKLFVISPRSFRPPPKVHSAVIRISPLARPPVENETERALVRRVVEAAFGSRRQQLINSLRAHWRPGRSRDWWRAHLDRSGIDPGRRAETVELEEFVALARKVREGEKDLEPKD
jgi:16S rRNA (adenine1518-N6/adenine1519-N6)-dimethyltransferase